MRGRVLLALSLICWIPTNGAASSSSPSSEAASNSVPADGTGLLDFLHAADRDHPELTAAAARSEAANEAAGAAAGLPDPVLAWSWFIEPIQTATGPQNHRLSLSQAFPWPGTLGAREASATHRAAAAEARAELTRVGILERIALAWYDYAWLGESTAITEDARELLRQQERILQDRYRTGGASHAELLRVQVELGRLEERVLSLAAQRPAAAGRLNTALGREVEEELPWPVRWGPAPREIPDASAVREATRAANPRLAVHRHDAEAATARATAANRGARPNFRVGVTTVLIGESELTSFEGQGKDAWSLDLAMSLPLWSGDAKAEQRQAAAERRSEEAGARTTSLELAAQAEEALFAWDEARRRVGLYHDALLPKAEEALRTTAVAYQTERASFNDFLETERTLLSLQLELAGARRDEGKAAARIFALMGESLLPPGAEGATPIETGEDVGTDTNGEETK